MLLLPESLTQRILVLLRASSQKNVEQIVEILNDKNIKECSHTREEIMKLIIDTVKKEEIVFTHWLASLGKNKLLKQLILRSLPFTDKDDAGNNPLHYAVLANKPNTVKTLLAMDDISVVVLHKLTPLTQVKNNQGLTPEDIAQASGATVKMFQITSAMREYMKEFELIKSMTENDLALSKQIELKHSLIHSEELSPLSTKIYNAELDDLALSKQIELKTRNLNNPVTTSVQVNTSRLKVYSSIEDVGITIFTQGKSQKLDSACSVTTKTQIKSPLDILQQSSYGFFSTAQRSNTIIKDQLPITTLNMCRVI